MLKDILENKSCFKLVCGAGNEDVSEVEKLVYIYSLAGCNFFDMCANIDVLKGAKRGLKKAGIEKDRYICVSVGIDGDPHITKAVIDENKCTKCSKCISLCSHEAITASCEIDFKRCIGCSLCEKNCPNQAITMQSQLKDYREILPELIETGIDCVEFHAISDDEEDVIEKWTQINEMFNGLLCISLDRTLLGDKKLKERVEKLIKNRAPYSTIIQADGVAMSGNDDELSTTLQAVATAQMFQKADLPLYIMVSGGTNTQTSLLAKKCGVYPHAIAVGSYARKIVKKYLTDEIYTNETFRNEAVKIAKNLIDVSLENMKID